jgi:deoxyribonuclease-4
MAAMLPDGRRLGIHVAHGGGMVRAAERAAEIGATAAQIFSDNPTAWQRRAAPSPEIPAFRARLDTAGISPLAIHASYLINLATPDPGYHERAVEMLASELRAARRFGASLVNVHIGSHGGAGVEDGIGRVVDVLRRALALEDQPEDLDEPDEPDEPDQASGDRRDRADASPTVDLGADDGTPPTIVLENSAGTGFALGVDLDELTRLASAVDAAGLAAGRVAFCLDTAHAWSAGIDLAEPEAIDAFLEAFYARIGLGRLPLVHLNDSKSERGARLDRHEHVGAGRIGPVGLGHLLRHPALAHVSWILETPGMDEGYDAINLERARALIRRETLTPLPPEAFQIRGSRSRAAAAPS